jgi:hypothetical protein
LQLTGIQGVPVTQNGAPQMMADFIPQKVSIEKGVNYFIYFPKDYISGLVLTISSVFSLRHTV